MHAWAGVLAAPAAHGWVPQDLDALIADWAGVHGWVPDNPHTAIGLLGAMLAWHGDPAVRPAAAEMAREAAELAAARARMAEQFAERERAAAARAAGQAALTGSGRAAALRAAAEAHTRALTRRTSAAAADTARLDAAVRAARGLPPPPDNQAPSFRSPASLPQLLPRTALLNKHAFPIHTHAFFRQPPRPKTKATLTTTLSTWHICTDCARLGCAWRAHPCVAWFGRWVAGGGG